MNTHKNARLTPHGRALLAARVFDEGLQGGVNGALNLDGHGKTLSFLLLGMEIALPATPQE
uniref:AtuA-related protein n=1 Tax=Halomonas sp. TaxID=1486246 RepID=UPI002602C657|nr:leucine zipper domain-containing protein [Halomonas sp.]